MSNNTWWGNIPFALDEVRRWQLANLTLQIQRVAQEWQISHHRQNNQHEDEHDWRLLPPLDEETMPEKSVLQRHIFNQTSSHITLKPQLADRSVVIKPITPLFIAPNQQTTLFVSTPLWLNVFTSDNSLLLDTPVIKPTETWFGATPIRGELCYATKVFARLDLEQLPIRSFRAVTPIHITNHHTQSMPIERINIPAPLLSLYAGDDGRLWTPTLEVEQLSYGRAPKIHLSKQLYDRAGNVKLLNNARQNNPENLIHLFENFFN